MIAKLAAVCLVANALSGAGPSLLVLNKAANELAIVDVSSAKVVARVPTGDGPHEIVVSADGRLAFVSNYGAQAPGSSLSVIDLQTRKELRRVDLNPLQRPHGLAISDGKVYFTAEVNKLVGRYDPAANRVDWMMGTGQNATHMVLVSKDMTRIVTANIASDTVSVIEKAQVPGGWNQSLIAVGKGPEGMDLSTDERELWVANSRDGTVSVMDFAAKKVLHTIDVKTGRSNRLKLTPDGKLALISDSAGGELVMVDRATRQVVKRVKVGRNAEGILIVPDGERAYVATSADNAVAVVSLKTLEVSGKVEPGIGPDGLAWLP